MTNIALFLLAALVIGAAGVRLTSKARYIARTTGLGEALLGGVVIGAITSLAGTVTSVTAAAGGHADLAIGNALGGIAAQTVFLVAADLLYRKVNLEHAAAAEVNLNQAALLILLLTIPLLAILAPAVDIAGVHPATILLFVTYGAGVRLIARSHASPMWFPRRTGETRSETEHPDGGERRPGAADWLVLLALAVVVSAAGWLLARLGVAISEQSGLSESVIGTLFTAVSTSLPELVIAIAAVRAGAVNLAVGDIIGGNTFDILFLGLSDIAYRDGSIFHAISPAQPLWLALCIAMTSVLLLGLLRREKHGIANIGFESVFVLLLYLGGVVLLFGGEAAPAG